MSMLALLAIVAAAETTLPDAPVFYAGNDELRGYLLEAAEHNPAVLALHAEWLAALERIPQAVALDDPKLSLSYFVQSEQKDYGLSLGQMFPWFGTRRARGDVAAAEADAALERLYAKRNDVFAQVKKAYFEYGYLAESLRVIEEQEKVVRYMEGIARDKYGFGLAEQDELLRVQMELSMVQDGKQELLQMRPALAAQLTTALGRENAAPPEWPQPCPLPPAAPAADQVMAAIASANPELLAADRAIDARHAAIRTAKKMGFPEFELMIGFEKMQAMPGMSKRTAWLDAAGAANDLVSGMEPSPIDALMDVNTLANTKDNLSRRNVDDDVMVSIGLSLPVWRKRVKAGIAEAEYMEAGAAQEKRMAMLELEKEARMALFGIEDAQRRLRLYDSDLLPKARLVYENLEASYGADAGAPFLDVLESVRTLLDYELEKAKAARDLQTSAAQLERLLGGPWAAAASAR